MAITLRSTKGLPLTHVEMDGNFSDLNTRINTLESAADSDNQTLTLAGTDLSISGGNTVDLSSLSDNTDSQTLTLAGTDLSISGGNTVDLSTILSAEADTLATVTARGAASSASIDMDGNSIHNINTLTPGSITQSDTGDFTSNFTTTITQDNQYTKFTKVDVFDDGEFVSTTNREIKLGANSLLFDSTVGSNAVIGNSSVGGWLLLQSGTGNASEGNADGGDIVITSGAGGVGGDGGNITLISNADIFVGPTANTLDIRIGGGPGYSGENDTFFYGNVNIDSGKKLDTESVTNSSGNLTLDSTSGAVIIGTNATQTIINGDVDFGNSGDIDFTGATVTGLKVDSNSNITFETEQDSGTWSDGSIETTGYAYQLNFPTNQTSNTAPLFVGWNDYPYIQPYLPTDIGASEGSSGFVRRTLSLSGGDATDTRAPGLLLLNGGSNSSAGLYGEVRINNVAGDVKIGNASGTTTIDGNTTVNKQLTVEENYSATPTTKFFEIETGAGNNRLLRTGINMSAFAQEFGPEIDLTSYRSSPANGDAGPGLVLRASTEASANDVIATIKTEVIDTTNGAVNSKLSFTTKTNGSSVTPLTIYGDTLTSRSIVDMQGADEVSISNPSGGVKLYGDVEFNNGTTTFVAANSVDFLCDVDFNDADVQNFAPGDIYANSGQYLYVVSKHAGGSATNVAFIYDDINNRPRQIFYGKTEFANNGEAAIVDFTGATVTGLTLDGDLTGSVFADDSTLLVDGVAGKIVGDVDITGGNRIDLDTDSGFYITNTDINIYGLTVAYTSNLNELTASGEVSLESTLSVTGNTALGGNLNVAGDSSTTGNSIITGNEDIAGTLDVTGNATLSSDASIGGNLSVTGNNSVVGTFNLLGDATLSGNASIAGDAAITGNSVISGTLGVTGSATLANDVNVGGNLAITGTNTATGAVSFTGGGELTDGQNGFTVNASTGAISMGGTGAITIAGGAGAGVDIGVGSTGVVTLGSGSNTVDFPSGTTVDFTGATISGFVLDWAGIVGPTIQTNGLPVGTRFTQPVPTTSNGASGDTLGTVAFDSNYIYYCTANYTDGVADIWKRVAWSTDTW